MTKSEALTLHFNCFLFCGAEISNVMRITSSTGACNRLISSSQMWIYTVYAQLRNFSAILQHSHKLSQKYISFSYLQIDWHLLSTLEPDLLHFLSVWCGLCHAYFQIVSPSFMQTLENILSHISFSLSMNL